MCAILIILYCMWTQPVLLFAIEWKWFSISQARISHAHISVLMWHLLKNDYATHISGRSDCQTSITCTISCSNCICRSIQAVNVSLQVHCSLLNDLGGATTMTEVHHAYNNVRWEPEKNGHGGPQNGNDFDDDGGANSAKLFERSRIKALAGKILQLLHSCWNNQPAFSQICSSQPFTFCGCLELAGFSN